MATASKYTKTPLPERETVPFSSAEEAWFWFIQAQQARNDGARATVGSGFIGRPCEPLDILKIVDDLYRNRRLFTDHFMVLRHYGRRLMAPDPRRVKELKACKLWDEAMDRMAPLMERKGIILSYSPMNILMEAAE